MNQDVFDQCNEANEQIKTKVDGENIITIMHILFSIFYVAECNDIAEGKSEVVFLSE